MADAEGYDEFDRQHSEVAGEMGIPRGLTIAGTIPTFLTEDGPRRNNLTPKVY